MVPEYKTVTILNFIRSNYFFELWKDIHQEVRGNLFFIINDLHTRCFWMLTYSLCSTNLLVKLQIMPKSTYTALSIEGKNSWETHLSHSLYFKNSWRWGLTPVWLELKWWGLQFQFAIDFLRKYVTWCFSASSKHAHSYFCLPSFFLLTSNFWF